MVKGDGYLHAAEIILDTLEKDTIRPKRLAELLGMSHQRAASLLRQLGWQREPIENNRNCAVYHRTDKVLMPSSTAAVKWGRRMARLRLASCTNNLEEAYSQ